MATTHAVPPAVRSHAESVPEGLRARLSGAELAERCKEIDHLHRAAESAPAEVARRLTRRAQQIAKASPVCEYLERQRELHHKISGASGEVSWGYRAVLRKLDEDNRYPDNLEADCDDALLGRPSTPEAEAIARYHRSG